MLSQAQFRELVSGRWKGAFAGGLRAGLSALEPLYAAAIGRRNRQFDTGRRQPHRVAAPIISVGNLTVGGTGKTPLVAWLAPVPVVVVGNITVGGTGKTPLVLWLAQHLRARGRTPGIVSRGYGGHEGAPRRASSTGSSPHVRGLESGVTRRGAACEPP